MNAFSKILLFTLLISCSSCGMKSGKQVAAMQAAFESQTALLRDSLELIEQEKIQIGLDYGRILEQTTLLEGVFFEVQIGAFQYFDLTKYSESFVRMRNDSDEEANLNRYTLGRFISYNQAKTFLKDIKKIGIEDAFVVGYIDGERSNIETTINAAKRMYGLQ